jgi:hypothetical protein
MNKQIMDKVLKVIDRSKRLRPLNMFLKETFDEAINQAAKVDGRALSKVFENPNFFAYNKFFKRFKCGS